jgi:hypothetical protein
MLRPLAVLLLGALPAFAADGPTVKVEDAAPPKELAEPVRALLSAKAMTVLDGKGAPICTVWPRKALESKATAEQAKAGLKYSHLEESTVIGAVRFPAVWGDYRKQKVKPGVYTLRLGLQPMDGDHMGTAPFNEFGLLAPAELDKSPDPLDPKELHALSAKASGRKHPGIMLLFPNRKPGDSPAIESKPDDHWVLSFKVPANAAGQKADLGFSLVVVGHSTSE